MLSSKPLINPNLSEESQALSSNLVIGYLRLVGLSNLTIKDLEQNLVLRRQYNTWLEHSDSQLIAKLMIGGASTDSSLALIRTKSASYQKIIASGSGARVRDIVLKVIQRGPISRNDIVTTTGLRINSVSARCNELLKEGLIFVIGYQFDSETERNVELLSISSTPTSEVGV